MRNLLLMAALTLGACGSPPPPQSTPPSPSYEWNSEPIGKKELDQALHWLPADTETLIVAQGPFEIERFAESEEDEEDNEPDNSTGTVGDAVRYLAYGSIGVIRDARFLKRMGGWRLTAAVHGSRNFRRPTGLGSLLHDGADILFVEDAEPLDELMKEIEKEAKEWVDAAGRRVPVFREKLELDEWSYHIVRPRPDVLICATNATLLKEVLERMDHPSAQRAFPADLPEWKLLDSSARVWAVRHYRRGREEDVYADSFPEDATAVGLVFFPGKDGFTGRVRVISKSPETAGQLRAFNNPGEGSSATVIHEKGIVEVTAECHRSRSLSYFLLVLLGFLGHGIFL